MPEQFQINDTARIADPLAGVRPYRGGEPLAPEAWEYRAETGSVWVRGKAWHSYTVSFFAWRIWEEISMYNHTTNHWDAEHLMQADPVYPEAQELFKSNG